MGAWGSKAFENDGACDFLGGLAEGDGGALQRSLEAIATMDRDAYLDVDDATAGVAAAELVAAALPWPRPATFVRTRVPLFHGSQTRTWSAPK